MWKLILGAIIGYLFGVYQTVDPNTTAARAAGIFKGILEAMMG